MAEFKSEESVFNIAMAYLQRIDRILTSCWIASANQDIIMWHKNLCALYREVSIKLKSEEDSEILGSEKDGVLDEQNVTYKQATFRNVNMLLNHPSKNKTHRKLILFFLDGLEIKLRRKLQEKGMLLPSKNDPRFAVLER